MSRWLYDGDSSLCWWLFWLWWWLFHWKHRSSTWFWQHLQSVTNSSNLSPTQTFSDIRHQHRFYHQFVWFLIKKRDFVRSNSKSEALFRPFVLKNVPFLIDNPFSDISSFIRFKNDLIFITSYHKHMLNTSGNWCKSSTRVREHIWCGGPPLEVTFWAHRILMMK